MEIAIIPKWLIKYLSNDYYRQNDFNILISNSLIIIFFLTFKNVLIDFLGYIPHFCLIDKIIGVECPVCGTTRAFCELSNGNLNNAYYLNATSILVALFFISQIPLRLISLIIENKSKIINIISKFLSRSILTIIVLNWIINLFINN
ncbi:MAG: DUF2752 domain-containing protein [Bacteroidales bacterium]|nr:DUF2752 domain-containing protein [Bacteroidales bacterium]